MISSRDYVHPVLHENVQRLISLSPDWTYFLYDNQDCRTFIKNNAIMKFCACMIGLMIGMEQPRPIFQIFSRV